VAFDIDANGIVNVQAKDLGTGKEQKITITAAKKMSKDEVERAIKEAERFAEDDKKRRVKVDLMNQSDSLIYNTEKMLVEHSDKVSSEEREKIQKAIEELKEANKGGDASAIKSKIDALTKEMYAVSERVYSEASKKAQGQQGQQGQQAAGGPPPSDDGKGGKDGYVDADYKIVDDDK
jgi:molecular chaperone DnaK